MSNDVVITRTFDAPISMVWQMWTDPEHFAAWYGPQGASIPVADMDVTVGGSRLICMEMQTPDGPMRMWFTGEFTEVTPLTRLAYTDMMCDENGTPTAPETMGMAPDTDMTTTVIIELAAANDATTMTITHVGVPADSPGAQGWTMAIDKLASRLASLS